MRKRCCAAAIAAGVAFSGFAAVSQAAPKKPVPKPKLRPLSSPANSAFQSDFPEMQGSDFQTLQPYSQPSGAASGLSSSGLSGVVPTSNMSTGAGITAPAPSRQSKVYGQMRTSPVSTPQQINSLNHQPAAAYGARKTTRRRKSTTATRGNWEAWPTASQPSRPTARLGKPDSPARTEAVSRKRATDTAVGGLN